MPDDLKEWSPEDALTWLWERCAHPHDDETFARVTVIRRALEASQSAPLASGMVHVWPNNADLAVSFQAAVDVISTIPQEDGGLLLADLTALMRLFKHRSEGRSPSPPSAGQEHA